MVAQVGAKDQIPLSPEDFAHVDARGALMRVFSGARRVGMRVERGEGWR